jgi:Novel toxin 17
MSFTIGDVVAAAGVGDPWELADQVLSGNPEAIRSMSTGFRLAAGHARTSLVAAMRADEVSAASYLVDGLPVHDGRAATASTRRMLSDGGELMGEVGRSVDDVATGLGQAQTQVRAALAALDSELAAVASRSNTLSGQRLATQAAADAATARLFDSAVGAVGTHGGMIAAAVRAYDELLRGRTNRLASFGYGASEVNPPGADDDEDDVGEIDDEIQPLLSDAELATIALDLAGMVDQTGISDALSGLLSLAQGDLAGAGLSFAALLPVIGAFPGLAKFARTIEKAIERSKHLGRLDAEKILRTLQNLNARDPGKINRALGAMDGLHGDLARVARTRQGQAVIGKAQEAGLPTDGPIPFVPPPRTHELKRIDGGIEDAYGNIWKKDPTKNGQEWDVTVKSESGKLSPFIHETKDGGSRKSNTAHVNVGLDGVVTH